MKVDWGQWSKLIAVLTNIHNVFASRLSITRGQSYKRLDSKLELLPCRNVAYEGA
jgi:hypothetical protein